MGYYIATAFFAGAAIALWIVGTIKFVKSAYNTKIVRKIPLSRKELKEIEKASIALKKQGADAETTAALDKLVYGSGIKEVIV